VNHWFLTAQRHWQPPATRPWFEDVDELFRAMDIDGDGILNKGRDQASVTKK
jgi:hypothetical protein